MVAYSFVGGPGASHDYDFSGFAGARRLEFDRQGPCTVSWSMDGRSDKAAMVGDLIDDLKVYRDNSLFFRGRIFVSDDTIGETHIVNMMAKDYRGMCEHRIIHDGWTVAFYDEDPGIAMAGYLFLSQFLSGGLWGVSATAPNHTTSIVMDMFAEVGQTLAEFMDGYAVADVNGFDWAIDENLKLFVWEGKRGAAVSDPLDLGGSIFRATRKLASGSFANAVMGQGQGFLVPEELTDTNIGTDARGRWESVVAWPSVELQEHLDDRTAYLLEKKFNRAFEYTLNMRQGWWQGPGHVWLGDELPMYLRSGRLDIATTVTVDRIIIELDEGGAENVTLEVS